jgi:hypothetical protein
MIYWQTRLDPRPIHDDRNTDESDQPADQVEPIGCHLIDLPTPEDRECDKDSAVGGIDAAKIRRLQRWDDPVENKKQSTQNAEPKWLALAEPQPDQISTADLAHPGKNEKQDRTHNFHDAISRCGVLEPHGYGMNLVAPNNALRSGH